MGLVNICVFRIRPKGFNALANLTGDGKDRTYIILPYADFFVFNKENNSTYWHAPKQYAWVSNENNPKRSNHDVFLSFGT